MVLVLIFWILLCIWVFILILIPIIRSWSNQTRFSSSDYYNKQIRKNKLERNFSNILSAIFPILSVTLSIYSLIYLSSLRFDGFWTYVGYAFKSIGIAIAQNAVTSAM